MTSTSDAAEYVPSPQAWVREQVEKIEASGGTKGNSMNGRPVVVVTHTGRKTGAIRKTPLMRVADGDRYILVGSVGGAAKHPLWVHNLRANPDIELRDGTSVQRMRVRELPVGEERDRLWALSVETFPNYGGYQVKTKRLIPLFLAEPVA